VYYADTYREGKEYFSIAHPRVAVISGADAATFRYIDRAYARDATHVYYEGVRHGVKDAVSFALLDYGFARDSATAYCFMTPIAGSEPSSFVVLDLHYAKDRSRVYWWRRRDRQRSAATVCESGCDRCGCRDVLAHRNHGGRCRCQGCARSVRARAPRSASATQREPGCRACRRPRRRRSRCCRTASRSHSWSRT
jgi:hypothetical protein